jgi:hypothetical protein
MNLNFGVACSPLEFERLRLYPQDLVTTISFVLIAYNILKLGGWRAIAQAVSRRLPTAATRVRARVRSCGICGGQTGTGAGFLRVLQFPLPIRIPPVAPHSSSSIIWGWYNGPNSGRSTMWIQSHPMRLEDIRPKPCISRLCVKMNSPSVFFFNWLFIDSFKYRDYITSDVDELEGSGRSLIEIVSRHLPGGLRKTTKRLSQDSWCPSEFRT